MSSTSNVAGPEPPPGRAAPTVVVTRPLPGARKLADQLEAAGFAVLVVPALEIAPPDDPAPLGAAAARLAAGAYDWVVLTSANGVEALGSALPDVDPAVVPARVAVVGPATAAAAERAGWRVTLVPDTYTGEGLLQALRATGPLEGARILLPVAERAREALPAGLREAGAEVDGVVAYRSVPPPEGDVARLLDGIREGTVDLITFASPSAAEGILEAVGEEALSVPAVVIGPVTGETARRLGYRVVGVAESHTTEGLVAAVRGVVRGRG